MQGSLGDTPRPQSVLFFGAKKRTKRSIHPLQGLPLYEPTEKVHNVKWINIRALLTGLLRKVKLLYIINVKCLCI